MSSGLAVSYEIVTRDRAGRERVHPYAGEDALAPGSVVLVGGRYWLVVLRLDVQLVDAGVLQAAAFRRVRKPLLLLLIAGVATNVAAVRRRLLAPSLPRV